MSMNQGAISKTTNSEHWNTEQRNTGAALFRNTLSEPIQLFSYHIISNTKIKWYEAILRSTVCLHSNASIEARNIWVNLYSQS